MNIVTLPVMQEKITNDNDPSAQEHGNRVAFRNNNTLKRAPYNSCFIKFE